MPSSLRPHRASIEQAFAAAWGDTTPIAWQGADLGAPPNGPWVRLTVLWGDGFERTIGPAGAGGIRVIGVLKVNVFVKPGLGTRELEDLVDKARDIVNRKTIAGVRFGAVSGPKTLPPGLDPEPWLQATMDAPFEVEETA